MFFVVRRHVGSSDREQSSALATICARNTMRAERVFEIASVHDNWDWAIGDDLPKACEWEMLHPSKSKDFLNQELGHDIYLNHTDYWEEHNLRMTTRTSKYYLQCVLDHGTMWHFYSCQLRYPEKVIRECPTLIATIRLKINANSKTLTATSMGGNPLFVFVSGGRDRVTVSEFTSYMRCALVGQQKLTYPTPIKLCWAVGSLCSWAGGAPRMLAPQKVLIRGGPFPARQSKRARLMGRTHGQQLLTKYFVRKASCRAR
jgi:hypothetical protein